MTDNKRCTVVVINYFNEEEIYSFVKHYLLKQNGLHSVLIVNNGSNDIQKLNLLASEYPNVHVLLPGNNLGYLGGFVFAYENNPAVIQEWFVLSNSDIEFTNENNLLDLMNACHRKEYAMCGPSIISTRTKHNQNPFYTRRISIFKLNLLRKVYKIYLLYILYQLLYNLKSKIISFRKTESENLTRNVYSIHGSFMMMRSSFIQENLESLRGAPFFFGEEIYLAELALAGLKKTAMVSKVIIKHHEHATTGLFKSAKFLKMHQHSLDLLYQQRVNTEIKNEVE